MFDNERQIAENVARVRDNIAAAALRSGRKVGDITLVAVSKYVDSLDAMWLIAAGCNDLGEARPQELWRKAELIDVPTVRWHLIGHLQSNKIRRTLPLVSLVHSVDSQRLLDAINTEAIPLGRRMPVLLEVNASGDAAKHGFAPDALATVLEKAFAWPHVEIRGLMTMAALEGGQEIARRNFASLRELRDRLAPHCPSAASLDELSMGMSDDYEIAIEEGATLVRVGSALIEGIER